MGVNKEFSLKKSGVKQEIGKILLETSFHLDGSKSYQEKMDLIRLQDKTYMAKIADIHA